MRIAIVHPSFAVRGGAENVVLWLAEELSRRGHVVTVFTSDFDERLYGLPEARPFHITTLDLGGYAVDPLKFIRAGWLLRRALEGFTWVNPHNFPAYIWAYVARMLNPRVAPIVWFCEEPVRWFYPEVCNRHLLRLRRNDERPIDKRPRWRRLASRIRYSMQNWRWDVARVMDKWVVRRLDRILTNSEFIAGQVRSIFGVEGIPCPPGIPVERPASVRNGQSPPRARYILTVSRLFAEKNVGNVLTAVKMLRDRGPLPFQRYVIAGDGPLRAALEAKAQDLALGDIVEFTGPVSDETLANLYRHSALVIYMPLDETFGLVFLEAAFYKRPVVGPDHGGPTEIIRHGVTGLQADPLDPKEIADAITYGFHHPDMLCRLGEEGHARIMREFTLPHFADRFEAALQDVNVVSDRRR